MCDADSRKARNSSSDYSEMAGRVCFTDLNKQQIMTRTLRYSGRDTSGILRKRFKGFSCGKGGNYLIKPTDPASPQLTGPHELLRDVTIRK
jgi:hypothetical protein